jgi:hypothetical protein
MTGPYLRFRTHFLTTLIESGTVNGNVTKPHATTTGQNPGLLL